MSPSLCRILLLLPALAISAAALPHAPATPEPIVTPVECPRHNPTVQDGTLVDQLWTENCDLVTKFLSNAFTAAQAAQTSQGTLESLQYYFVQDYYYLTLTVPHKAYLLKSLDPDDSAADQTSAINETVLDMAGDLEYASSFLVDLTSPDHLNVSSAVVKNAKLEPVLREYVHWLGDNTNLGWYLWSISRLPCIYGWAEIAYQLNQSSSTVRGTKFFNEWLTPNLEWSYGAKLSVELQEVLSANNNTATFAIANGLFRKALEYETAFFESALGKIPKN
ncbi:TENA THI-4 family [Fusarium subglutinans]|uniref:TENA THI-4 family n=1 Tax=Gibberella subglutinans TaxID=42677 RepID=A0A8H5L4T9_GIBSU|nr:TENA THI-4 family [Fusarium subglutinans]KAF5586394.1 TENA THI-4 family [Fusarium subglutinans]